jgi:hypothetical protein
MKCFGVQLGWVQRGHAESSAWVVAELLATFQHGNGPFDKVRTMTDSTGEVLNRQLK